MKDSWLAIVDSDGLQLLVAENCDTRQFLIRRSRRDGSLVAWAVLEGQHADYIDCLLRSGYHRTALQTLQRLATDGGSVQATHRDDDLDYIDAELKFFSDEL